MWLWKKIYEINNIKLEDAVFVETEEITTQLKISRNDYINEAVHIYNTLNKRRILKKQLAKESILTSKVSIELLREFEKLMDEYEAIWFCLADLNPSIGTEPGKKRPVVIVQTDLLNETHLSTLICPITSNVQQEIELLRVHLKKGQLDKLSDVLVDQLRAIDNKRFISKLGKLNREQIQQLKSNLKIVLDQ